MVVTSAWRRGVSFIYKGHRDQLIDPTIQGKNVDLLVDVSDLTPCAYIYRGLFDYFLLTVDKSTFIIR